MRLPTNGPYRADVGNGSPFLATHLSHAYMERLAQKLNEDTNNDRHAVVLLFTDRRAAETHKNLCDTTPEREQMNLCAH
ncbi:MAG: hypothetical protein ACXV44_06390 [Halobacteriota archaeon]